MQINAISRTCSKWFSGKLGGNPSSNLLLSFLSTKNVIKKESGHEARMGTNVLVQRTARNTVRIEKIASFTGSIPRRSVWTCIISSSSRTLTSVLDRYSTDYLKSNEESSIGDGRIAQQRKLNVWSQLPSLFPFKIIIAYVPRRRHPIGIWRRVRGNRSMYNIRIMYVHI